MDAQICLIPNRLWAQVSNDVLFEAQALADSFAHANPSNDDMDELFVFAMFLQHCSVHGSARVAQAVFQSFCDMFDIASQDIHGIVGGRNYDEEEQVCKVLKAYFSAYALCKPPSPRSALLSSSGELSLMAVFGGNTGSASYYDQAKQLVDIYGPLVSDFVIQMSEYVDGQSRDRRFGKLYAGGLDIRKWIADPKCVPRHEYLLSSPVSIPLIGLVQLMQLVVLYKTLGISPGELACRFSVATGHSQGIISAVLLSTLTGDEDSFISGSKKALGLWMLVGAFPQLAFPCYQVFEHGSNGSAVGAEYTQPTPMVSVQGLTRSQLTKIIDGFNAGNCSRVQLAVANTVNRFVVAGQLENAAKFARYAKSLSAAPGEDQTKLPLALRKPVISVDFLGMTVPYHCDLLTESVKGIYAIAQEKGWTFDAADMRIAVRSSYDGHDIRSEPDLTKYLIES
ncbi:fatty acid synthase alpha subunit Lsd1, partial [Coemansia sp. IMI 203386]